MDVRGTEIYPIAATIHEDLLGGVPLTQNRDIIAQGFDVVGSPLAGADPILQAKMALPSPIVVREGQRFTVLIQDNLSTLVSHTVAVTGQMF